MPSLMAKFLGKARLAPQPTNPLLDKTQDPDHYRDALSSHVRTLVAHNLPKAGPEKRSLLEDVRGRLDEADFDPLSPRATCCFTTLADGLENGGPHGRDAFHAVLGTRAEIIRRDARAAHEGNIMAQNCTNPDGSLDTDALSTRVLCHLQREYQFQDVASMDAPKEDRVALKALGQHLYGAKRPSPDALEQYASALDAGARRDAAETPSRLSRLRAVRKSIDNHLGPALSCQARDKATPTL